MPHENGDSITVWRLRNDEGPAFAGPRVGFQCADRSVAGAPLPSLRR